MNFLLDTHSLIWFLDGDPQLGRIARKLIEDPSNRRWISIASLWELAIKISKGHLVMRRTLAEVMYSEISRADIEIVPIKTEHILRVASLPLHHGDPFDRLIVAQSLEEGWPVIGKDSVFSAYGVRLFW